MKLFLLATIAALVPGTTMGAKGEYRPFGAKAPKTRKPQHGVFDAKAMKSKTLKTAHVPKTTTIALTNGTSSPIDEGRDNKNSEDGGLVHETSGGNGSGSAEGGVLLNETFDDDVAPSAQGFDPVNAMFEWLKQCTEANLDKETCLVTMTLDSLVNMDGPSQDDDATYPTRRRRVQEEGGCRPELSEQDLRDIMNGSRADCSQVSIDYSNEEFEEILAEFWKVFSSESCWEELCESPDIFFKLMFDHAVQCANVEFDVDQCITDQIFSMLFAGSNSYDDEYATDDSLTTNHTHHALRSLQKVVNEDGNTDCVVVNKNELAFFASFVLMEAQRRCVELGVSVILEDISKASADLVNLFGSPHCWGDTHACPDDDDDTSNTYVDAIQPNQDPMGDANGTSSSSETSPKETNEGDSTASSDEQSDEADKDTLIGKTNTSTFDEQSSENGDGASFITAETVDENEATKEDHFSLSTGEDGITDVNQTSDDGGVSSTSSTEDDHHLSASNEEDADETSLEEDANDSSSSGTFTEEDNLSASTDGDIDDATSTDGEGNVTSTEEDQFSTSVLPENGTTPISSLHIGEHNHSIFAGPQVTGESCDIGPRSGISERSIEVPYFYIVETVVLEGVVDEIEGLLHLMMCINGVDRRLAVESDEKGVEIVALLSSPKDVVSTEYVCVAQSEEAQSCNVIEGMITLLIVEGDNSFEQEEELMTNFYLHLAGIFDLFSSVEDSNIVLLEYVGSDPSSLMTRAELIEEEEVASNDSNSLFKFIAIGASIVTLVMLIAGWKMKDKDDDDSTLDGKPIDDKSLAVETAAMTMTTSGSADDSSDISSTHDAKEFYRNKAFVLAEEEESSWRHLGILPNQLEDIREEFSHSGSEFADEKSM